MSHRATVTLTLVGQKSYVVVQVNSAGTLSPQSLLLYFHPHFSLSFLIPGHPLEEYLNASQVR